MPLAKPGDPYISKNGVVVLDDKEDAFGNKPDVTIGPVVARTIESSVRRSIADMPTDPRTQTAMNVVLVYSILGLTDVEISHTVGIQLEDVKKLKHLDAYQETYEMLFHECININSNSMQSKIAAYAPHALEGVMSIAKDSKHEIARLKANQDILDRSGLHPETLFGKNNNEQGFETLKIVFQDGEDEKMSVNIDVKGKKP